MGCRESPRGLVGIEADMPECVNFVIWNPIPPEGRIDLAFNYDDVSGDPKLDDRWVGSVTYTQKLTDSFTLPLSLVYANHEKYLRTSTSGWESTSV